MTRYAGPIAPRVEWDLTGIDGTAFEELIAEHLQDFFHDRRDVVTVERTPPSGDHGRDIIVMAQQTITLFGIEIPERADRPTKIYVECKKRTGDRLDTEFFFDFSQFADTGAPDYYFLVTTASLSPNVHFKAVHECGAKGAKFRLIDGVLLAEYVAQHEIPIPLRSPVTLPKDILVEYQPVPYYRQDRRIDVYVVLWNYASVPRSFHVYLSTNDAWHIIDGAADVDRIVEPRNALVLQLIAQRRTLDHVEADLEIAVTIENERRTIRVSAPHVELAFVPTLVGTQHLDEKDHLRTVIDENVGLTICSVTGRAGVGKSRIVQDALEPRLGKSKIELVPVLFDATGGTDELRAALQTLKISEPTGIDSVEGLLAHLLQNAPRRTRSRVILLEDLHHARKPVLDLLKQFVMFPPTVPHPVTVILTGRNDYTFPNEDYFSLLDVIAVAARPSVVPVELQPLSEQDTYTLIRSILRDAPETVITRIYNLSEHVPYYVTQAIEYLLESGVAHLVHRSEVGIPHLENFSAKEYIPDTVDALYELRLKALGALPHGEAMLDFLTTQSFFGVVVSPVVREEALDADTGDDVLQTLIARRFLSTRQADGRMTFAHENLLAVLRARARAAGNQERAGKLVLSRPRLFALLTDLERAEVLFLARALPDALTQFHRLVRDVERITNFSSEDLDVEYFRYIDAAFECAVQCNAATDLLRKMLLAKAYMGIHNYPLKIGVRACDTALEQLKRVKLRPEARNIVSLELRQLQAHGLLNMGKTMRSSGIMLELDQLLRSTGAGAAAPELVFDLYDRLQEVFKKWNHAALARCYGALAREVVDRSGNPHLRACHAITESGMALYRDPEEARRTARWSFCECRKHGAYRLKVYTRLSMYVAEAVADPTPRTWEKILWKAKRLWQTAALKNLSDSLMRVQLLVATLTYLTRPDDLRAIASAEEYARAGIDSCANFGKGLYSWLLYNLLAVLADARRGEKEEVWERFNSARRELDAQGLLFVGRKDCTYPTVFVISNIAFFRAYFDREDALRILGQVTDYESDRTKEARETALRLVRSKSRLFFRAPRGLTCLADPKHGYWLPLL
ncbi:MAG TPA: AAA family ATPase [Thermoanaerobaculia bacterium]|nr:AAA family ATPase [Thermoanaerobaculia bacterium]